MGEVIEKRARQPSRADDLIVAVEGDPVDTMTARQRLLVGERIGSPVTFTVARHESIFDIRRTHGLAA